jgi:hypothetical protein
MRYRVLERSNPHFHRFIFKSWHVFSHLKTTTNSPRFHKRNTATLLLRTNEKYPFFATPPQKHPPEKNTEHHESLTPPPERDTLFKFGAAARVSSSQGLQERLVCPIDLHAPHAAQSMRRSGQRSTAPRLRF